MPAASPQPVPVAAMSVRELIGALALVEDLLRTRRAGRRSGDDPTAALTDCLSLQARGAEIVDELRRRSAPCPQAGQHPQVLSLVDRVLSAERPAGEDLDPVDPDSPVVGDGAQGEHLGERVVRVLRVPQDGVEGRPRGWTDPDGVEPAPRR